MGFDNEYPKRKDWRKPYHGAAAVSPSCRPGGGCPACDNARKIKDVKRSGERDLREWRTDWGDER